MVRLKRLFQLLRENSSHAELQSGKRASHIEMHRQACMSRGQFDHCAGASRADGHSQSRDVKLGFNAAGAGASPSCVLVHGLPLPGEDTGPDRQFLPIHRCLAIELDLDRLGIGAELQHAKRRRPERAILLFDVVGAAKSGP